MNFVGFSFITPSAVVMGGDLITTVGVAEVPISQNFRKANRLLKTD
jgi:hypothetical protein